MAEDFRSTQFNKSLGGYSVEDVDKYIDQMNGEYLRLEQHCKDSDRKLLFALRKLEALTIELQNNYSPSNATPAAISIADDSVSEEVTRTAKDLEAAKKELEETKALAARLKKQSETKAVELIRAANEKAESIVREAEASKGSADEIVLSANERADKIIAGAKLQADAIVAGSSQKARQAAEQIITEAALNSRKIIREAETKANNACRDVLAIYKAAEEMYNEVSSFRGSLFSLYSDHIESIESITGSAHGLIDSVDGIVRELENKDKAAQPAVAAAAEQPAVEEPKEAETPAEPDTVETETVEAPEAEIIEESAAEPEVFEQLVIGSEPEVTEETEETETEKYEPEEPEEDPEDEYAPLSGLSLKEALGEYYDSFDEIPEDDEVFEAEEPEEEPVAEEEAEPEAWTEPEPETAEEEIPEPEEAEAEITEEAEKAEDEPETADEEFGLFTEPEEKPDHDDTDELIATLSSIFSGEKDVEEFFEPAAEEPEEEPAPEEEEEQYDFNDFELPDEVSGGTNVLDIVKNIGGQQPKDFDDDFSDIEKIFASEMGVSADEFNRVFPNSGVSREINEIRNQPTVAPSRPQNPKKHSKF